MYTLWCENEGSISKKKIAFQCKNGIILELGYTTKG